MTIVTLLSDYGTDNTTAGLLKGIILSLAPQTTLVDLGHRLPPQDVSAAQFELDRAYCAFPKGTIHMAIIDPGIGSKGRPIALETENYFFVGPDNGLFTPMLERETVIQAVLLYPAVPKNLDRLSPIGVFRGRDYYAPAAGLLSAGEPLSRLGEPLDTATLQKISPRQPSRETDRVIGAIQRVDPFGNLVTNIPSSWADQRRWRVRIAGHTLAYDPATPDISALLRIQAGGHGYIEIVFAGGSATQRITAGVGQRIELFI